MSSAEPTRGDTPAGVRQRRRLADDPWGVARTGPVHGSLNVRPRLEQLTVLVCGREVFDTEAYRPTDASLPLDTSDSLS